MTKAPTPPSTPPKDERSLFERMFELIRGYPPTPRPWADGSDLIG